MVCYARGWDQLRPEDCGGLWEHLMLDTLIAAGFGFYRRSPLSG